MAEGRMLKRVITTSRKLAELKTDSARLLYTWLIPFLDVEGRFYGNPDIIKGFIIPRIKDFTTEKVTECLFDMQKVGLILWYQVDGDKYLEFTCFEKHQNINKDREAKSSFPISTQENSGELLQLQENSGELSVKLSKDKLSKDKYSDFVLLTEKELSQLIDKLGESQTQEWIEKLNNYIGSTERQYKSHYYTILNWSKKDSKKDIEEELTDSDRNQIQSEKVFREWTEQLRKEKEAEALNGTD